jgi:hypothetical protein
MPAERMHSRGTANRTDTGFLPNEIPNGITGRIIQDILKQYNDETKQTFNHYQPHLVAA